MKPKKGPKKINLIRTYKFRAYPTTEQSDALSAIFLTSAEVYNILITENLKRLKEFVPSDVKKVAFNMSYFDCINFLYKSKLKKLPIQTILFICRTAATVFKKYQKRQIEYPGPIEAFKSFGFMMLTNRCLMKNAVRFPIFYKNYGAIEVKFHRPIFGQIKFGGIKRERNGWHHVFLVVNREIDTPKNKNSMEKSIAPTIFNKDDQFVFERKHMAYRKLKGAQIQLEKLNTLTPKTKEFEKQRLITAEAWRKVVDFRNDKIHKLSREMVSKFRKIELNMDKFSIKKGESSVEKSDNLKYLMSGPTILKNYLAYKSVETGTELSIIESEPVIKEK